MSLEDFNNESSSKSSTKKYDNENTDIHKERMRAFFLGLVAGEGSFSIKIQKDDKSTIGVTTTPQFSITLSVKNRELIDELEEEIPHSNVYTDEKDEEKLSSIDTLTIESTIGCKQIIEFIDAHSEKTLFKSTEKYASYQVWKKCVNKIDNKEHLHKSGIMEIAHLRMEINESQRCRNPEEIKALIE